MQSILADSGPLVALYDAREPYHQIVKTALRDVRPPVLSTWPVLTEAMHLLPRQSGANLLRSIGLGALQIVELGEIGLRRTLELMRRYEDVPIDLADASLMALAELRGIRRIATIEFNDFETYRLANGQALQNIIQRRL